MKSMNALMDSSGIEPLRPTMKWVKGELHDTLSADKIDSQRLIENNAHLSPFDKLAWFERVAAHWGGQCDVIGAHSWHGGQHCWLFLARRNRRHAVSLSNWYSFAFRPVFAGDQSSTLLRAIAKRMASADSVPPIVTLAPVPRADGSSDLLVASFQKSGWIAHRSQSSTNWTANVAGKSFDDYWAERPGQLRNTFQRKSKKTAIETEILTHFDEDSWTSYESVYGESWKPPEGAAEFLKETAKAESDAGCYRLGLARLDGEVIAAQFWTVCGGIAYIHKLAHREEHKDLSPGTILSVALFRHVIDIDRVTSIDFGTGNDRYKADWMDRSDPLDTIRLYKKRSPIALIAAGRERLSALVRGTRLD